VKTERKSEAGAKAPKDVDDFMFSPSWMA